MRRLRVQISYDQRIVTSPLEVHAIGTVAATRPIIVSNIVGPSNGPIARHIYRIRKVRGRTSINFNHAGNEAAIRGNYPSYLHARHAHAEQQ